MNETLTTSDTVAHHRRKEVLVIATSDTMRRGISHILARVPFDVRATGSLADGLAVASADPPDLVVLECGATDAALAYTRALRAAASAPVILVGSDADEGLRCLESGAVADYVQVPIWQRELQARAVHHADGQPDSGALDFGELLIDLRARAVWAGGAAVELTPREFDLLAFLASQPHSSFTRDELLQRVWRSSPDWQRVETVTQHVYRLRGKLEADPSNPQWIVTLPGSGYCFRRPEPAAMRHEVQP